MRCYQELMGGIARVLAMIPVMADDWGLTPDWPSVRAE